MKSPREMAESFAEKMKGIIEEGEEVIPICLAVGPDDHSILVGFEMADNRTKDMAAIAMRMIAKFPGTQYVMFLCDSWVTEMKQSEIDNFHGSVRDVPGHKEAIVVSIFGSKRMTEVGSWKYDRVDGKPVFAEKLVWAEPGTCEGRFVPASPGQSTQSNLKH